MEVFVVASLEIQIDDTVLAEAKKVLHSLGLDVEMAVNIYLRRIALEKGLPMPMAVVSPKWTENDSDEGMKETDNDAKSRSRANNKITAEMIDEVWQAFLRYTRGLGEINPLSTEVSIKTGMNRGSAFIYLTVLTNLVKGEPNTRVVKYKDLVHLMDKIRSELGESQYQNALRSLEASVPYWREKISGTFADKVENYCRDHSNE